MSLPPLRRSASYPLQVLLAGRVRDRLFPDQVPREPLTVRLRMRDEETAELQDFSLSSRVRSDGTFAFFGVPEVAFPHFAERSYQLQIDITAPNYLPLSHIIDVGPADDQPQMETRSIPIEGIEPMRVRLFTEDLPHTGIDVELQRIAVRLRGRVVTTSAPPTGISGANLEISTVPRATTDDEGYFEFADPMPLERAIAIAVSADGFVAERLNYDLDYSQRPNELFATLRRTS